MAEAVRYALNRLLLAAWLALVLLSGWRLSQDWPGTLLVERAADRIAAALETDLARAAADGQTLARLSTLLDDRPRNWIAIDAVADELDRQGIALPPDMADRLDRLRNADHGTYARIGACLNCAADPTSCPLSGPLACGVAVQLTPVGDVQALARAGAAHLRGEDIDRVDVMLASVGLGAVALVPLSGGSSLAVKSGVGLTRLARAMGRLPDPILRPLIRAAREGIDWARLPAVRSGDDLAAILRPAVLQPAVRIVEDGGRLRAALGLPAAIHLLGKAEDARDLRRLAVLGEAAPTRSVAALEVLGKSRALRLALRASNAVLGLLAGFVGLAGLIAASLGQAIAARLVRRLRR